jgi:hypothetical protein
VAEIVKKANLTLFVHVLRNEFVTIPYDYFSDPIVEIDFYINPMDADGIVTEFPSTAMSYLSKHNFLFSPCFSQFLNEVALSTLIHCSSWCKEGQLRDFAPCNADSN